MYKNRGYRCLVIVPVDVVTADNLPVDERHGDEAEPEQDRSDHGKTGSRDKAVGEDVEDSCAEVEGGQNKHIGSADAENVDEDDRPDPNYQVLKAVAVASSATNDTLCVLVASLCFIFDDGVKHRGMNVVPCLLVR